MMERILRLLPWYSLEAQARRASRTKAAHHRAIRARINAERVIEDYTRADAASPRRRPSPALLKRLPSTDEPKQP